MVTVKAAVDPRWFRTLNAPETLADDLGALGAWVGPRTGPDKRTHGQKEDYVLRRLLVAWKLTGRLRFPIEVRATTDEEGGPDFLLFGPDGQTLGVEVTEAGEEDYQAWLTRTESDRAVGSFVGPAPVGPSAVKAVEELLKAISRKAEKCGKGAYRGPQKCDLAIYDNTGCVYDLGELRRELHRRRSNIPSGPFDKFHLVKDATVFLDLLSESEHVDLANIYEIDYAAWIFDQVEQLRQGKQSELDLVHIAEELSDLGRSERRALASHLRNLLVHFLIWQFQPDRRGPSWRASIVSARSEIFELLTEMPSLRADLPKRISTEYARARQAAAIEAWLDVGTFPEECPYSRNQLVDAEFFPGEEE